MMARNWNEDRRTVTTMKLCQRFCNGEECPYGDKCHSLHEGPANPWKSTAIRIGTTGPGGLSRNGCEQLECKASVQLSLSANLVSQKPVFWKTRLCKRWDATGNCPYGVNCYFAHGHAAWSFQIQRLNCLIERLHPKIRKARRIMPKSRIKNLAKIVWNSVAGDPLGNIVISIRDDLNWWLESQWLTGHVEEVIESTARDIPTRLKVNTEEGYPISTESNFLRSSLEQENTHRVILIVGFSGIGKSCLARQVASDPPLKFVDGAVEVGFGQWCSRAACNGSRDEYHKRLARRLCKLLVQIGFWKNINNENSGDLEYICCLLQEALYGKSTLILLDDVWEQDIVEQLAKLYDIMIANTW